MKFVHTSDWHLGHCFRRLGPRAGESLQWRFDAVRRIFDLARAERADFIVVAGDVFETETPTAAIRQAAAELLREAPVPIYIIAGNHDPCVEGSVWLHPAFNDELSAAKQVRVVRERQALPLCEGEGVLFACPVFSKHSREDATAWMPLAVRGGTQQVRIGLAHGRWRGYWMQSTHADDTAYNEIAVNCAERCGLDYLALGDFHSYTPSAHPAAQQRTFYSGTPEVAASDDARAGYALVVEIASPGAAPVVVPHRVGRLCNHNWGVISLVPGTGVSALEKRLATIERPQDSLLRVALCGSVSQCEWNDVLSWISSASERVLVAEVDTSQLVIEPTRADFALLDLALAEQHLLDLLEAPMEKSSLQGVDENEIVVSWSQDEAARRAARTLYFQLLRGDS